MHGDARTKIGVLCILFCLSCARGLFWSRRPAAMFGTLTKYNFAIYSSIFTGLGGLSRGRNMYSLKKSASF